MAELYCRQYKVRNYECDIYKHVNNAVYLRYLDEAALEADAHAGFDPAVYEKLGLHWWTSYLDIEYLLPLQYGETVRVTTIPIAVSSTACIRQFEVNQTNPDLTAARATALANLKTAAFSEAAIPAQLSSTVFSGVAADPSQFSNSFSPTPQPPAGAYSLQRTVRWHDLNAHNEMDMATLLGYIDDCGRRVVAAHNWPVERMLAHGFGILLRRNEIEYKEPARLDDELLITTYASSVKRATATRHYLVERLPDGKILARINALGVWVNLDSGQPIRVPPEFIQDFEPNISA